MDAATIVGLLADDDRRRCWAALELGASTREELVAATGLDIAAVGRALARLVTGGLVVAGSDGGLHPVMNVFAPAAREALWRPPSTEHDDQPDDVRKVLRSFVTNGRITQIPVAAAKRRLLLDWLAQDFEPGRRYSEKMVNLILGQRYADTAALRRYLVDEGLLDRAEGDYWRAGGSVGRVARVGIVDGIADHYESLGVSSSATRDELRIAYRNLARKHHPDAKGTDSNVRMSQINEAWRVLSDPGRRAMYDASIRSTSSSGSTTRAPTATATAPTPPAWSAAPSIAEPSRFPWRFMLVLAAIGIAFVLVSAALTKPTDPVPPDNVVGPGSCVDIELNGDAREVPCDGTNQGVVVELIDLEAICPAGTEGHRDHQGLGQVCVRLSNSG